MVKLLGWLAALVVTAAAHASADEVRRVDFRVTTEDHVGIHVREVSVNGHADGAPLILVHGARMPGIGSFDLPVPGGSLAADLARRTGRPVYVMDARGYGASDRPAAMSREPKDSQPLSRGYEVVRDIDAVVAAASARHGGRPVALFGWATGGLWVAYYASLHPERVDRLVLFNALYGGASTHAMLGAGSGLGDPADPSRIAPDLGGYARYTAAQLYPVWDRSIPLEDKNAWRDPAVAAAYGAAAIASDPESSRTDPPRFRAPLGALEDSFYQANGRRLYDASTITARVLVLRSQRDFWSRPEDATAFAHDAAHARGVELLTLPDATHMAHLDRAEHGRDRLLEAVTAFLAPDSENRPPPPVTPAKAGVQGLKGAGFRLSPE